VVNVNGLTPTGQLALCIHATVGVKRVNKMCLKSIRIKKLSQWDVQLVEEAAGCVVLSGDCSSVMMSKVMGEGWKADDYYYVELGQTVGVPWAHGVTLFLEWQKLWWTESTFLTSSPVRVDSLLIGLVSKSKPSTKGHNPLGELVGNQLETRVANPGWQLVSN